MKSEMVEKLPADLFQTARRLGAGDRSVLQVAPATVLHHLDTWIGRALEALSSLHATGLRHGEIDVAALRVDPATMTLRLGSVLTAFPEFEAPAHETFDPHNITAPPERLLWDGFHQGLMFSEMMLAIEEENSSYDVIPALLPQLPYTRATYQQIYESIQTTAPDWAAADVWMLGFAFLRFYEEIMAWPYVMSSEFYRTRHEILMEILERMLAPLPKQRITAEGALKMWIGRGLTSDDDDETNDDETTDDDDEETSRPSEPLTSPTETPVPPKPRRLVLNVRRGPVGHNKTRRSPRS